MCTSLAEDVSIIDTETQGEMRRVHIIGQRQRDSDSAGHRWGNNHARSEGIGREPEAERGSIDGRALARGNHKVNEHRCRTGQLIIKGTSLSIEPSRSLSPVMIRRSTERD